MKNNIPHKFGNWYPITILLILCLGISFFLFLKFPLASKWDRLTMDLLLTKWDHFIWDSEWDMFKFDPQSLAHPPGVKGTILVSTYYDGENPKVDHSSEPLHHTSVFVNRYYDSKIMEDNDMRGFLDGGFRFGWNQSGQKHVRVGRRQKGSGYGEYELFRTLQRWEPIALPPSTRIFQARLSLAVEIGAKLPLNVYLYEVKKDWNPGRGGVNKDNNSPPEKGEVWWVDRGFGENPWSLPGAGFASDDNPKADTSNMPLAVASFKPEDKKVDFSSPFLTEYIAERVKNGQPLLFLIKLSDYEEDIPGTRLTFYSGDDGSSRFLINRPHLFIEWGNSYDSYHLKEKIFLEYGRTYRLPSKAIVPSSYLAASFLSDPGFEMPTVEVRGGKGEEEFLWRSIEYPVPVRAWDWIEVRLKAMKDPLGLNEEFFEEIKDTWVTSGSPEEQEVMWTFISPTGKTHLVNAEYRGDYTWSVTFRPNEIGRWWYSWRHHFMVKHPTVSESKFFDVMIIDDSHHVITQAENLLNEISHSNLIKSSSRLARFEIPFLRLERAAVNLQGGNQLPSNQSDQLNKNIKKIREALSGRPVPKSFPLAAMKRKL